MEEKIYYTLEESKQMIKASIRKNAKEAAQEIINNNRQYV